MTSSNIRKVVLRWSGEALVFRGGSDGGPEVTVDSTGVQGSSPMSMLLLSLAGCMGIDVVDILTKSRVPLESLEVEVTGERAETVPKRFVRVELVYRLSGPGESDDAKLQRAVDLSREKYCSVLHTLDPNLDVDVRVERV